MYACVWERKRRWWMRVWIRSFHSTGWVVKSCVYHLYRLLYSLLRTIGTILFIYLFFFVRVAKLCVRIYGIVNAKLRERRRRRRAEKKSVRRKCFLFTTWWRWWWSQSSSAATVRISNVAIKNECIHKFGAVHIQIRCANRLHSQFGCTKKRNEIMMIINVHHAKCETVYDFEIHTPYILYCLCCLKLAAHCAPTLIAWDRPSEYVSEQLHGRGAAAAKKVKFHVQIQYKWISCVLILCKFEGSISF